MRRWNYFLPALMLTLALSACAPAGTQTSPPPSGQPSQGPGPSNTERAAPSWDETDWSGHLELDYAQSFAVDYSPEGYKRITIDTETYLVVPELAPVPEGTPEDVTVLRQPIQNIYLQATAAMDCFRKLDALDAVTLVGTDASGWYLPEVKEAMAAGRMAYAGKYSAPDYELLQARGCGMALESTMIYHNPEVKEQLERLGIPVLVERSSYESHPLGRMEWVKLYGVLLNREEEAGAYYEEQLARLEPVLERENTGKTVAFFAVTASGMVTVRKPGDYIAKAIGLAGGVYALNGLGGEENALSTMNIQMESFYEMARDADILIYNSAIESALDSLEQLVDKSPPLAEFKAVREGNVWCTGKSMFQESQSAGEMMLDIHRILTEGHGADGSLAYLYRLT